MSRHRVPLGCTMGLIGVSLCPLQEWGAHPGQVCSGTEINFAPIAQGRDLSGWWRREPKEQEPRAPRDQSLPPPRLLLIDEGQHPRAWLWTELEDHDRRDRDNEALSFGCRDYIDHPLVLGQVNISPDFERSTIQEPGCTISLVGPGGNIQQGTRRKLVQYSVLSDQLCLNYKIWDIGSNRSESEGTQYLQRICFRYLADSDTLEITSFADNDPPATRVYRREVPGDPMGSQPADNTTGTP